MTNNTFLKVSIVVLALTLAGCVPPSIINEVSLMHNVGYDKEEEMLKASVVYPNYAESDKPALITAAAKNPSSLQEELSHKSQFPFEIGQVRLMIFGDQLSREGLACIHFYMAVSDYIPYMYFIVGMYKNRKKDLFNST